MSSTEVLNGVSGLPDDPESGFHGVPADYVQDFGTDVLLDEQTAFDDAVVELMTKSNLTKAQAIVEVVVSQVPQKEGSSKRLKRGLDPEDPVRMYLDEIGQFPLLDKEAEGVLGGMVKKGLKAEAELSSTETHVDADRLERLAFDIELGHSARAKFVQTNLRLVVSIAKKYTGRGLDLAELIQEGNLGLDHAVGKFDPDKGFKFSTYATWWIRQGITRAIADQSRNIRLPIHFIEDINKLWKVLDEREADDRDAGELTVEEVQEIMKCTREKAELLVDALRNRKIMSLDQPADDSYAGSMTLGDVVSNFADEVDVGRMALSDEIDRILIGGTLEELESQVVRMHFGFDGEESKTLAEIAEILGLKRGASSKILKTALNKIRESHPDLSKALT